MSPLRTFLDGHKTAQIHWSNLFTLVCLVGFVISYGYAIACGLNAGWNA